MSLEFVAVPISIYAVVQLGASSRWCMRHEFQPLPGVDYASMSARHAQAVEIPRILAELGAKLVVDSTECSGEAV